MAVADTRPIIDKQLATRLKRRAYNLQKQLQYKAQHKAEVEALKITVHSLESHLSQLTKAPQSKHLLPWHQVAQSMLDAVDDASKENASLRQMNNRVRALVLGLSKMTASVRPMQSPDQTFPIHTVRLGVELVSRREGYKWLSQALYHNTDAFLNTYGLPPCPTLGEVVSDTVVDSTNFDNMKFASVFRVDVAVPMECLIQPMRDHIIRAIVGDDCINILDKKAPQMSIYNMDPELEKDEGNMRYIRRVVHTPDAPDDIVSDRANLYREYHEPNRVVLVAQNIPLDEVFTMTGALCKNMAWVVLNRLGESMTSLRIIRHNTHCFTRDGTNISFDDEIRLMGVECDEGTDEFKLKQLQHTDRYEFWLRNVQAWRGAIERTVRDAIIQV
ncbi:unnamed protein product [Aphanomyces euteiches]|uniref:Uncharacterized protein n=1 Tax=Aphanomyces euteiches TaxID=100861 RepID=A0A6G0XCJ1_9STRA|nr:hypothetical protein Ae201684_005898 [Aphanomyces euteiches]KAH9153550.1 hypothetical protein AeRB84_004225 [Aphanomyces euteiches]